MNQKPKIQYVGQFYVHGSEARQLQLQEQKRQAKTKLPLARIQKIERSMWILWRWPASLWRLLCL